MHTELHGDVFEQALIPMARIAVDGSILAINEAFADLLGTPRERLQTRSILEVTAEDDREMTRRLMDRLLAGGVSDAGQSVRRQRKRYLHADGHVVHTVLHSRLVCDEDGKPAYFFSQVVDRTPEEQALQRHREREAQLQGILDSVPDAVIAIDNRGAVLRMNPTAETWLGVSATAAQGMLLSDICPLRTADGILWPPRNLSPEVLALNPPPLLLRLGGLVGCPREVSLRVTPVVERPDVEATGMVLALRDVGAEQKMQEQLRQVQKLEAIEQLAGGVAHDFNNLLAAILGSADLLRQSLPEGSDHRSLSEQIVTAAVRAGRLTQQLLTFSSRSELRHAPIDVHELIQEVCALLFRCIDGPIGVSHDLRAERFRLHGDPGALRSALLNVGLNAADAIRGEGQINFDTEDVQLSVEECRAQGLDLEPGRFLQIRIVDDGCGIPSQQRHRIFEPFYTTKVRQNGAGLGLAEAYGCVRRHGGVLQIFQSGPSGTTLLVLLPSEKVHDRPRQEPNELPIHGVGEVLLVDDEEAVLRVAARALESLGYTVTSCGSGAEALDVFAADPGSFSLVVLDQVMPGMRGSETLEKMRQLDPEIPVVMATGFSNDELGSLPVQAILPKPYLIRDLSEVVHRHLRAPR